VKYDGPSWGGFDIHEWLSIALACVGGAIGFLGNSLVSSFKIMYSQLESRVAALEVAKGTNASRIAQIRTWIRTKFRDDPVSEGD